MINEETEQYIKNVNEAYRKILNEADDVKTTLAKIKANILANQAKMKTAKKPKDRTKIKDNIAKLKNRAANLQLKMKPKEK